jgi:hypothetical protein
VGGQRLLVASIALAGLACREHGAAIPDAATDGSKNEGSSALTLVIAVTGCARYEAAGDCGPDGGTAPCCRGAPPLTLSFAPVGSPELNGFKWSFGDDPATTTERAPSHVYAYPGKYRVTLTGAGNEVGMLDADPLYVVLESLPAGAPCDVNDQCGDGLTCLCAPGGGCAPAFTRGFCSMACGTAGCDANAVCAAPALGAPGAPTALCLAACQTSAQCAPGYVCQTLPSGSTIAATSWTRGCLPLGAARDLGGPCRNASDVLADDACATRLCADVGALGVCSASCDDSHPCPDEARCTPLADGRQLCLAACTLGVDCDRDPLLACAPPSMSAGPTVTVCAPKRCTGDAACAPSGRCGPDGVCVRK